MVNDESGGHHSSSPSSQFKTMTDDGLIDSGPLPEEGVNLIRAFLQIEDSATRRGLVHMAMELARGVKPEHLGPLSAFIRTP